MKELLRGESTISLEAAVLKCPNAELYLTFTFRIDTLGLTKVERRGSIFLPNSCTKFTTLCDVL
jgi:hypothetical protein